MLCLSCFNPITPQCISSSATNLLCSAVMIGSPGDREALEAGRLGLSHWADPSVTGSAREVSDMEWGYHS